MKKIVIILGLILVVALIGLGAAYFAGIVDLPIGAVAPTPTIVILVGSPEPAEAAAPEEEVSGEVGAADEGEEGDEFAEADEGDEADDVEETDEGEEVDELEDEELPTDEADSLDSAPAESAADTEPTGIEGIDTPTPVMALPSATPTSEVVLAPTSTATPTPMATATPAPAQAPAVVQATAEPDSPSLVPTLNVPNLNGEWEYNSGTMSLNQSGVSVSGTFRWYGGANYGKITGSLVYNTNQFRGLWISDINPVVQGFTDWRIIDEGTFTGSFESGSRQGQWCGVRAGAAMPAGCGFSGVWNLHFGAPGNVAGRANLTQIGGQVTGTYTADDGRSGEIVDAAITVLSLTEATLQGTWRSSTGESGPFEWRLNQTTNQTFEGRNLNGNSEWCGWREGAAKPEPCGF